MHQLTIKKRNEWVGKKLDFKIYIDEIEAGMVNSSKPIFTINLLEGHHKITIGYDQMFNLKYEFGKDIFLAKNTSLSINSQIRNPKSPKICLWIININLLILFVFGHIDFVLYGNAFVLLLCLPVAGKILFFALFKRDEFFRLVTLSHRNQD